MKTILNILACILIFGAGGATGFVAARAYRNQIVKLVPVQDPNYVQPPCEAQRRLKEQGLYQGRIDNIWGKETDKAFCDYCAIRAVEGR